MYQISIIDFQFWIHCLWYNERLYANVTFKNLPFKIGFNLLAGRPVAWIYPYSLINLTLKAKRMFIHIWNLVNCRNYLSYVKSGIQNGEVLISYGKEERIWHKKQLTAKHWWSSNKWWSESNISGGRNFFVPAELIKFHACFTFRLFERILHQQLLCSDTRTSSSL